MFGGDVCADVESDIEYGSGEEDLGASRRNKSTSI